MLELQRWLYAEAGGQLKSFASGIDPLTLLTSISIAALFGLVHAFMPGHGKTVLVSYFLGRPSKVAAGLGASIILVLTHVGSAVVLVLTGFIVIRGTIGGAGRAPEFEIASAAFYRSDRNLAALHCHQASAPRQPHDRWSRACIRDGSRSLSLDHFHHGLCRQQRHYRRGLVVDCRHGSGNDHNNCNIRGRRRAVARAHRSSYGQNRADTRTFRASPGTARRGCDYRIRVVAAYWPLKF